MPVVRMPDGAEVRFPDDMPKEQIKSLIASKFPEAVPQASPVEQPKAEGYQRSTILPLGKDLATGEISFAVPGLLQGLFESGKQAVTAPGRAYSGELQVMGPDGHVTPEAIQEGLNFAGWASPASPASGLSRTVAKVTPPPQLGEGQQAALAAQRLGVDLPRAAASDRTAVQQMGKALTNVPIGGTPLRKASETALNQLDDAAMRVQQGFGSGDIAKAGALARQGVKDYSVNTLDDLVSNKYGVVDSLVDEGVTVPLTKTRALAARVLQDRKGAALPAEGPAIGIVKEAIARPEGLNYYGIKRLRTDVGAMLKNPQLAPQGTSNDELKALYGSLSDDLKTAAKVAGGDKGLAAFEEANTFAAKTIAEQKVLDKIIGPQSDEGLFSSIQAMAGSNSRANIESLMRVRKAVSPETWNEISSSVISKMGRAPDGNFTPDRFITAYGKLSPTGKRMLFRSTGKEQLANSLEDIATVSRRFKQLNQFANPSGTAQNLIGGAIPLGLWVEPTSLISSVASSRVLSSIMAKPTSAKKLAEWAKAYEKAVVTPTAANTNLLGARARVLAIAVANDAGNPGLSSQIYPAISMVRKVPAQPEQGNQRGTEGQNDSPANEASGASGLIEPGNLDLAKRPKVRNDDGSYSTVRSMSFNEDGQEILIPTVSKSGNLLTDEGAIALYHATGEHLGKFATPAAASAYAQKLHDEQEQMYGR